MRVLPSSSSASHLLSSLRNQPRPPTFVLRRSLKTRPIIVPTIRLPPLPFHRTINTQAPGSSDLQARYDPSPYQASAAPILSQSPLGSEQYPASSSSAATNPSAVDSDAATTGLANASSLPAPPERSSTYIPRHLQHPFDTHAFVNYLEKSELGPEPSRALMEAVREMIIKRGTQTRRTMVGKEDAENAAYLFNAALSELRTELSVQARNDGLALKAMAGAIRREVEGLEQKIKEDVQVLKHDIEMDMNNRKAETRTEMKGFEIYIEEINNKFTISLGDLRTEIESVKWDATRRAISIIILIVVATIAVSTFLSTEAEPKASSQAKSTSPPAVMRDMAVGTDDESLEEDVKTYTEERLEKLLSDSGVARLERRKSRSKEQKKEDVPEVHAERI